MQPAAYDGLLLPGGHAPGMRQYLGSDVLREKVAEFWALGRPVAAICHGVLVLARTREAETACSPLYGRRTTCLPRYMERAAYLSTAWKLGRYYRDYPQYVEAEVRHALAAPTDFVRGPRVLSWRGTADDDTAAFVVEDGNYVSARWPGDAYLFARRFEARLRQTAGETTAGVVERPVTTLAGALVRLRPADRSDMAALVRIRRTPEVFAWWRGGDDLETAVEGDFNESGSTPYVIESSTACGGLDRVVSRGRTRLPARQHGSLRRPGVPPPWGRHRRGADPGPPPHRRPRLPPLGDRPERGQRGGHPLLPQGGLSAGGHPAAQRARR